jgi:SAM-dependent methyltransferase
VSIGRGDALQETRQTIRANLRKDRQISSAARSPEHGVEPPSDWVARWAPVIARQGEVLDLACGAGRHVRFLAARGLRVCAVDRDPNALEALRALTGVTVLLADLEGAPWPLRNRKFDGVVVTNYLHRPLMSCILDALAPAGVLIYETFATGNERFGKPSNPDFLLRPGELLEVVRNRLQVIAYEDLETTQPRPARIQRICASAHFS